MAKCHCGCVGLPLQRRKNFFELIPDPDAQHLSYDGELALIQSHWKPTDPCLVNSVFFNNDYNNMTTARCHEYSKIFQSLQHTKKRGKHLNFHLYSFIIR